MKGRGYEEKDKIITEIPIRRKAVAHAAAFLLVCALARLENVASDRARRESPQADALFF